MRALIFFILCLSVVAANATPDYNSYWQKGNTAYQQKDYEMALANYEKIAAAKPGNAEVYYNLGNTYYKLNQVGPAVLNYERALKIDPSYKNADENLYLTQGRISNRIQAVPDIFFIQWWNRITSGSNAGTWAIVALLLFLVFISILIAKRMGKARELPVQLTGSVFIIWLLTLTVAYTAASNAVDYRKAVIMETDTPFMANPQAGKALSLVPEGTTVTYRSEKDGWIEISLPDGRTGWVRKNMLTKI